VRDAVGADALRPLVKAVAAEPGRARGYAERQRDDDLHLGWRLRLLESARLDIEGFERPLGRVMAPSWARDGARRGPFVGP